jgi:hypothetical protein
VVLTASSTKRDVVSGVEDNSSLGEHGIVLDFCLSDGGAVVGEDDELGLAVSQRAQGGLVAEHVLATLDDEGELAVNVLRTDLFHHSLFIIIKLKIITSLEDILFGFINNQNY